MLNNMSGFFVGLQCDGVRYSFVGLCFNLRQSALGRSTPVTLSSPQSNQKSSQQKGFFAARGYCPAKRAELGLELLPRRAYPPTYNKFKCPPLRSWPSSFCPLSAEAVLLTGKKFAFASATAFINFSALTTFK